MSEAESAVVAAFKNAGITATQSQTLLSAIALLVEAIVAEHVSHLLMTDSTPAPTEDPANAP